MANSAFWRDLAVQFSALRDKRRRRAGGANDSMFISALETLAMRGASEIAVAGTSDLLHIWLEQLRKEGLPFQSSGQSNEVLSEAESSESIYKGFTDGLCEASATFCNRREAQAVQAEFEEKQRNNPKNWSQLRQNFEAFKGIRKLATGPHETIPEVLVRDVLARQYGIKPEKVTWQQIRTALADLGRDYPAITLVPSGLDTSPPDSTPGEIDRRAKFLADYKAATKPPVLADIRERFLRDAAILRIESREGVCDRLTHNSDPNGALNHPYKVASAGFTEWMENLGKFAAGHVMTLARMAHAHCEWGVADPAEWARIQVAEFVDDELYPKRCRKCGKSRSEHSGTDHEFRKAVSRIELWWRIVSGEEEDFDLHDYGRPERWSAPVWIRKDPEKTADFLRARHFNFDERLKWVLHDAEGDARIKLCLVSVNSESVAELAPGGPNTGVLSPKLKSPLKKAVYACLAQKPDASDKEILDWLRQNNPKVIPAGWDSDDSLPGKTFTKVRKYLADHRATQSTAVTRRSILPPLL